MDVLVLIDKLDDTIHNAKPVPLTDQVRVDKEEVYDILDQMRATIPEEIKQARWIVNERQEMLAEAKREAERIIREAREEQIRLIGEEGSVKQAGRQAAGSCAQAAGPVRQISFRAPSLMLGPRKCALSATRGCDVAVTYVTSGARGPEGSPLARAHLGAEDLHPLRRPLGLEAPVAAEAHLRVVQAVAHGLRHQHLAGARGVGHP